MARRLNDTRAVAERPFEAGEDHSISTRKIENGYLTRVSTCNPGTGEYRSSEVFTKTPPNIRPPELDGRQASRDEAGSESLGDTMRYLREAR